jgi:uncharacterized protein (TIRG00374 family)
MKRVLQIVAGLAISAGALWLTLRGKDLGAIWEATRAADYRYLVAYLPILIAIHLIRTVRWGLLLKPVARVSFARLNAVSAVGFMGLTLLPFRLGEFARPLLISEKGTLRTSSALSSIVVERAADGVFMGLVLVLALLGLPDTTPGIRFLRIGGVLVTGAFAAAIAFLVFAYRNRAAAVSFAARLIHPISAKAAARISGMLDAFIHGLRVLPGGRSVALFFALTAAYWALNAYGMGVLAAGFGFHLSPLEGCILLGVLVVGVMIPAGPGMIGTFQGAIAVGLSLIAPAQAVATRGVAYANMLWAAQLVQVTALGIAFMFSSHVKVSILWGAGAEVGAELEEEETEYRSAGDGAT